jgi:glucosyl-3-phosphoglycerate synthase
MSDFIQFGMIRTLHNLGNRDKGVLLEKLKKYSRHNPAALLLPSLYSDLFSPAMDGIIAVLRNVEYLDQVVIALDRADREQFLAARERIASLPQHVRLVWLDGERIKRMFASAEQHGLETGKPGKGRAVWMALGYVIACERATQVILHDCDILTYSEEFLARLCFPLINPRLGFEFVKGYYPRFSDRLNGRVVRLFVTPLVNALITIVGHLPLLEFLRSFRYPLAGEFGMSIDLAKSLRIPYDWGIEVTVLAEIFRTINPRQVCQVDICDHYDHKHQQLSIDAPEGGLMKMAIDIAVSIIRSLATEGVVMSPSFFSTLRITYLRKAQDAVQTYQSVADLNGLEFDRHAEGVAIEAFSRAIRHAAEAYIQGPLSQPLISNWNRVVSAEPTFFEQLVEAVEQDNRSPVEV